MSNEDNRSEEERRTGQPARSRFQQPGSKPPSPVRGKSVEEIKESRTAKSESNTPASPGSTTEPQMSESEARPFPAEAELYADHPLTVMDRLQSLYDQAGLNLPLPKRWSLGVSVSIADADNWDQVQATLRETVQPLLPIALRVTAVEPTVRDQQGYSVGWLIDPNSLDEVRRVRAAVVAAIQPLTPDLAQTPLDPAVLVADEVEALAFPTLIAAMQHEFVPFAWSIDSLVFVPPERN